MKKYFILLASATLMLAASCNKIDEVNTIEPTAETELITVELNPMTKTSLNGLDTKWTVGDVVSVTVGSEKIGDLTCVEGSTFSGEVKAGYDGKAEVKLHYPSGVTSVPVEQTAVANSFANGAALLDGTTTMDVLRAGEGATLSNSTALLQFTTEINGDVAFTIGSKTYTVAGCEANSTYYACVNPTKNVTLSYTIAGIKGAKSKTSITFDAGSCYNLSMLSVVRYLYVKDDLNWGKVNLYAWRRSDEAKLNGNWPGNTLSTKVTVADNTYYRFEIPAEYNEQELGIIFNNGDGNSYWRIDIPESIKVPAEGMYYRLSARGAIGVDPYDVTTFKYCIYIYDQKDKAQKPTISVNSSNGTLTECYYKPADEQKWRRYYYYEVPTNLYGKDFSFMVKKSGSRTINVTKLASDIYVGYWYDNASSNGFWIENDLSIPITQ